MSHLLFHLLFVFHHSRCDTASSLFASKCLGERYAWTAALCDLGDPGWGDPWFPHWALLLLSPSCLAPLCGSVFSWFCFFFGGHTHNDTQDVIVHVTLIAGSDPTSLCFVLFGVVWLWLWVFCLLGCFCFWFVFFVFLMGQLTGLRTGPLPVLLWLSTSRQPCMIITMHLFAAIERV